MEPKGEAHMYPAELLCDVSWTFRGEPFIDRAAFDAAVAEYQDTRRGEEWRPNDVILHAARVRVSPDVHWYLSDDHPVAEFTADNGRSFTAGELLYKIHNRFVSDLRQMDHQYFQGLELDKYEAPGNSPLYDLDLGS